MKVRKQSGENYNSGSKGQFRYISNLTQQLYFQNECQSSILDFYYNSAYLWPRHTLRHNTRDQFNNHYSRLNHVDTMGMSGSFMVKGGTAFLKRQDFRFS